MKTKRSNVTSCTVIVWSSQDNKIRNFGFGNQQEIFVKSRFQLLVSSLRPIIDEANHNSLRLIRTV